MIVEFDLVESTTGAAVVVVGSGISVSVPLTQPKNLTTTGGAKVSFETLNSGTTVMF